MALLIMTLLTMTLLIMTFLIMTFIIMTFHIMTFLIMTTLITLYMAESTKSDITFYVNKCNITLVFLSTVISNCIN
jgi:hypothetical protein